MQVILLFTQNRGWSDATDRILLFASAFNGTYRVKFIDGGVYNFSAQSLHTMERAEDLTHYAREAELFFGLNKIHKVYLDERKNERMLFILYGDGRLSIQGGQKANSFLNDLQNNANFRNYCKALSQVIDKELGIDLLTPQYERFDASIGKGSALFDLLSGNSQKSIEINRHYIFPFAHNLSQMQAVKNALSNSISIIEGPPGTGKTQTILNLIANIVIQGKNVAVISNNNKAVENVFEKLDAAGYGTICARLGSVEKREQFFQAIPTFEPLEVKDESFPQSLLVEEKKYYASLADIATKEETIKSLKFDYEKHVSEGFEFDDFSKWQSIRKKDSSALFSASAKLEKQGKDSIGFFGRLFLWLQTGIPIALLRGNLAELSARLSFYASSKRIEELTNQLQLLKQNASELKNKYDFSRIISGSRGLLNKALNESIANKSFGPFTFLDYKRSFTVFTKRYPIILSSTFSLGLSIDRSTKLDYVIIDEASQSDPISVLPALNCAKNAVIIGDDMQLPPVISDEFVLVEDKAAASNKIEPLKRVGDVSFLSYVERLLPKVPKTTLQEHYRCQREIINFSNQRFYDERLQINTVPKEGDHLKLIITAEGNHARRNDLGGSGLYNQREIDEIVQMIPLLGDLSNVGVITPYRRQAEKLSEALPSEVQVGTIHTFQGREKGTIIFSAVANDADDYLKDEELVKAFVNNEQMINVAVTRARDRFIMVAGQGIAHSKANVVSDLIKYLSYQSINVHDGKVHSIFDSL